MSIFASETQSAPIPIPFDAPHWVIIRTLTGLEAEQAQASDALGMMKGRPRTWAERLKRMVTTGDPKALEALADPLIGYDRFALIRSGLLAWSYPRSITAVPAQPAAAAIDGKPATAAVEASDAITDLVDEAAEFIATEILKKTKPSLFETVEQAQASRKND